MYQSTQEEIIEVINKLFIYTDARNWGNLQAEVFAKEVDFDMSSLGGEKKKMTATAICSFWEIGFQGIDQVSHLAGNYLVSVDGDRATAFAYATATHYKAAASQGTVRQFVGTYDFVLARAAAQWRITGFRYDLKFMSGNPDLS